MSAHSLPKAKYVTRPVAAFHRSPRPGLPAKQGKISPLDKVPAHDADHCGICSQGSPRLPQQVQMAGMHGIVFYNHTRSFHKIHPNLITKK